MPACSGRYPSGQRGQTVNLLAYAFGGSNPPLPTTTVTGAACPASAVGAPSKEQVVTAGGNSSAVERQPSKLGVAGSNPVSRSMTAGAGRRRLEVAPGSIRVIGAHVAQTAEHVLGKDGVTGSSPVMGSTALVAIAVVDGGQ